MVSLNCSVYHSDVIDVEFVLDLDLGDFGGVCDFGDGLLFGLLFLLSLELSLFFVCFRFVGSSLEGFSLGFLLLCNHLLLSGEFGGFF